MTRCLLPVVVLISLALLEPTKATNQSTLCLTNLPQGAPGRDGLPGKNGRDGLPGQDGRDGLPGQDGRGGLPGKDGRDGLPGQDGRDGQPGQVVTYACGAGGTGAQAISQEVLDKIKQEIKEDILSQMTAENPCINECTRNGTKPLTPKSCHDILKHNKTAKSGIYEISNHNRISSREVYCDLETLRSGVKGWTRVASFDMTNSSHSCPSPLQEVSAGGKRLCRRSVDTPFSSVKIDNFGISYTQVCGRAIAYQFGNTNAFSVVIGMDSSINAAYVDGISITHGSPRKHVWTFAVGRARTGDEVSLACPCSASSAPQPPQFVGRDYYCDSVNIGVPVGFKYYLSRPIWDGQGCPNSITCCDNSKTPWFCKTLPNATTDQIEVRWMSDQDLGNEATPTELLELYIH